MSTEVVRQYVTFIEQHPELFQSDNPKTGKYLITEPEELEKIDSSYGIQAQDSFMMRLNMAVRLPDGSTTSCFKRFVPLQHEISVLFKMPNGNFVLEIVKTISNLFHARVCLQFSESQESDEYLGALHLDTGYWQGTRPLYVRTLESHKKLPQLSQAAAGWLEISPNLLRTFFKNGKIFAFTNGSRNEIHVNDANIGLALLQNTIPLESDEKYLKFVPVEKIATSPTLNYLPGEQRIEINERFTPLHNFLEKYPEIFSTKPNILTLPCEIAAAEKSHKELLEKKFGQDKVLLEHAKCGIIHQDNRTTWIRIPVQFPNGTFGLQNEIVQQTSLERHSKTLGSAALPRDLNDRILLVYQFRVSTALYELEIPRGVSKDGEDTLDCAVREAEEETGRSIQKAQLLGHMTAGLNINPTELTPVYDTIVGDECEIETDPQEGIEGKIWLTVDQTRKAYLTGSYALSDGTKLQFADPFLAFALGKTLT